MKLQVVNGILRNAIPIIDSMQKRSLIILWKQDVHISEEERRLLWLRATGAAMQMTFFQNRNYYNLLDAEEFNYPNPSFNQIDLDLKRTFSDLNNEEADKLIPPLRRILRAYVKRNPTVGYC